MSNNKNNGKKAGIAGGIGTLLLAAVASFLVNGFGESKEPDNPIKEPEAYEAQMWQDLDAMQDLMEQYAQDTESVQDAEDSQDTEVSLDTETVQDTDAAQQDEEQSVAYSFRNEELLQSHYEKHGVEMGFASAEEYEEAANKVVFHPDVLYKLEAEDNDHVYYLEETNEFVVISTDGYIRTYFLPDRGIDYFNAQ